MSQLLVWVLPLHTSSGSPAADTKTVQLKCHRSAHTLPTPCASHAWWQSCPAVPNANSGRGGGEGEGGSGLGGGGEGGGEGGCGEGCEERLPCEAFLSVAAINLLRGVTPPHDAPGAAATEEYGRYGAEEPAQRYERVLHRPADALFCMQCATTYSLSASASLPTPHGAAAATGGREASAKE